MLHIYFGMAVMAVASSATNCPANQSDELIITYDGYYSSALRRSYLSDWLQKFNGNVLVRPNDLSDFDVVEVDSCSSQLARQSLNPSHVIRVTLDQQFVARRPLNSDWNGIRNVNGRRAAGKNHEIHQIAKLLGADKLWELGYKGQGVKVGVFDTGLPESHSHFRRVVERTDWTNEQTADDGLGHGTFVAGVIGGTDRRCPGLAPSADLYIYKVFTKKQVSYTSWFLDAFNHAILRGINVLNLSIGGPDFTDQPFIDKVWELTANGIILISAIGNDGPQFGTLNNPADQMDVIGVGGINLDEQIARFSSRGMTTWELPGGYGRVKPDIVTFGSSVFGSSLEGGCRALSGTSVASPVVTGAVALMLSAIQDRSKWNPAAVKQALIEGAQRLPSVANMFEQGAGKMNLIASFKILKDYQPSVSLIPPYIDFMECLYMWPYCSQPLYASALPTIFNITIVNGLGVTGRLSQEPIWEPFIDENGAYLSVSFAYSDILWPWSGYLAVVVKVRENASRWEGTAAGRVRLTVESDVDGTRRQANLSFLIRVRIVPTPPRSRRVLWDQYRNLRYPPGYFPRDDLRDKSNPLDWNGDHPHTNFRALYQHLRSNGYYMEMLGEPLTCVNTSHYALLMIVDPEDEFFPAERDKLFSDVTDAGLNVVVFADWYNTSVIDKIRFMDDNTKQWWQPETGGANIPAVNALLAAWNLSLGSQVFEGTVALARSQARFASGSSVTSTAEDALVGYALLTDQGYEVITGVKDDTSFDVPVFAITRGGRDANTAGFVAVFGDSNCLESLTKGQNKDCFWLLDALLDCAIDGDLPPAFRDSLQLTKLNRAPDMPLPKRVTTGHFTRYSKVVAGFEPNAEPIFRPLPVCKEWPAAIERPVYNVSLPADFNRRKRPLASLFGALNDGEIQPLIEAFQEPPTAVVEDERDNDGGARPQPPRRIGEATGYLLSPTIETLLLWLSLILVVVICIPRLGQSNANNSPQSVYLAISNQSGDDRDDDLTPSHAKIAFCYHGDHCFLTRTNENSNRPFLPSYHDNGGSVDAHVGAAELRRQYTNVQ
uniref:Peptidase S8/S53 domain-containing protein n=1 Tax=Plectus sambesii TaxID=2011161 RepID=A0A914W555_9BILA